MDERAEGLKQVFWNPEEKRLRALFRIPVAFALGLFAFYLIFGTVGLVSDVLGIPDTPRTILLQALVFVAILLIALFIDRRWPAGVGFGGGLAWLSELVAGVVVGFLMVGVAVGTLAFAGYATIGAGDVVSIGPGGLLAGLVFYIGVSLIEEFILRGYLLVNIAEGIRGAVDTDRAAVGVGVVATAGLFGALHAANPGGTALSLLTISLAGLFFGGVVAVTGRLAFPIGVHISWNFGLGPVFGLPVSGLASDTAVVGVDITGSELVTGGTFGPEGGLVMFAALAAGIGVFVVWASLRGAGLTIDRSIAVPDLWSQ